MAASDTAIIAKNSAVRRPMVDGSPMAGGFGGYLKNGTSTIAI